MTRIVITGANRGIGLALCGAFHARGAEVIACCRQSSHELNALGITVVDACDFSQGDSIAKITRSLGDKKVDVLINNAAIADNVALGELSQPQLTNMMTINAIMPLLLTQAFVQHLMPGSKVILMTSRMGSISDNESGARYGYRMSKAALNAAGKSLAIDLSEKGILVGIVHPGHVATDMGGPAGISIQKAVEDLMETIENLTPKTSGIFKHANGETLPW